MFGRLRERLISLYYGDAKTSLYFRYSLLVFDVVTISFFIIASMVEHNEWFLAADYSIAIVLILDYFARMIAANNTWRFIIRPMNLADVVVIGTLLAPLLIENFAFLRVVRALRLLRSYHVLKDFRDQFVFFREHEQVMMSILNLMVFIFFVTALVYVFEVEENEQINTYIDALYFTVTTLTTTGFGDITLEGPMGRMLSVVIMVFGISLFLRLVQTIFRPSKVNYPCPKCGLVRHEPDAVHCKHCGDFLQIKHDGDVA
ncbi:ion channel [Terasakiella sp. A23]|uniref:potassium channel family protein n=1 Tax=Terasakiella sp. FCG-A23 TaxID=3080561 RepID=UPI0029552C07|nr:ion channel [Terasakiella sp. A23]MDV7341369.1 ion channel [Terasakiella sp. A23]